MAVIDQFLATCANPRWHPWNNIKVAHRILIGSAFIWILHTTPCLMYYNITVSPITGKTSCDTTNVIYQKYINAFYLPLLTTSIPVITMIILRMFGISKCSTISLSISTISST